MLAVGTDAREDRQGFLRQWPVDAFLQKLGIAKHGGERRSQLMAHVGDELRLVLARDLELLDGSGKLPRPGLHFLEEPRVLDGDHRLVGKGSNKFDLPLSNGRTVRRISTMMPSCSSPLSNGTPSIVRKPPRRCASSREYSGSARTSTI